MILGTHNSLTYLKPQWWVRPFNFISKCQSLNLLEQYKRGVRLMDFRFRWNEKKEQFEVAHGLAVYKEGMEEVERFLFELQDEFLFLKVRIVFEYKGDKSWDDRYINLITYFKKKYPTVIWLYGYKTNKKNWILIEGLEEITDIISIQNEYWRKEINGLGIPICWARKHNKEIKEKYRGIAGLILMMDFIEI